ncbi:type II toxin-antitoxin system VapC family toxin [Jiella endophytica]|uniref:Ribonuclease VapC n=1 Tax=Jiella endophytica TaxID=2558362 RepID=A0A4Y8RQT2_9HYPH|nr:type II toxin-antitoxin system VapC family toxin [Jiella endophytica]TFF25440.1 type II toxin-antitoxin system VapC family toxin [Jiella endophytica]
MIAVDTSALIAVLQNEERGVDCLNAMKAADRVVISAGTTAEALIVATRRRMRTSMSTMIEDLGFEIIAVTPSMSRLVADAHRHYGKGVHPASLNFGDCFAYALAKELRLPLLYIGNDFAQTDITAVI